MGYVNISDYKEALTNPSCFFRTLKTIEPLRDRRGEILSTAGSNSVVFYAGMDGKEYALKCYTSLDERRDAAYRAIREAVWTNENYPAGFGYLPDEILTYRGEAPVYYPVLLMEKVRGKTLGRWLGEKCADRDTAALTDIAVKFDHMALWLLDKPFAHGDLKPDNIIVTPCGELRLIDFDGMYTPEMEGLSAPELGTPEFRHPRRDKRFFNKHIDDYPAVVIAASLHALADFPELYAERCDGENIIFHPDELTGGRCTLLKRLKDHWVCEGRNELYRLTSLLASRSPAIEGLHGIFAALADNPPTPESSGGLEIIRRDGFYGFGDTIAAVYDDASPFSEGLAAVRIMKRRFYIDTCGRKVIDGNGLEETGNFSEGLAAVKKGGGYGYIDKAGAMAIEPVYEDARAFREGLAAVKSAESYGFIDHSGRYAIAPSFDSAGDFRSGIATVVKDGRYGYINRAGEYMIEPLFDFASGFRGGRAKAEKDGEKYILTQHDKTILYERILGKDNT